MAYVEKVTVFMCKTNEVRQYGENFLALTGSPGQVNIQSKNNGTYAITCNSPKIRFAIFDQFPNYLIRCRLPNKQELWYQGRVEFTSSHSANFYDCKPINNPMGFMQPTLIKKEQRMLIGKAKKEHNAKSKKQRQQQKELNNIMFELEELLLGPSDEEIDDLVRGLVSSEITDD